MQQQPPTGTVTLLLADLVGPGGLGEADAPAMRKATARLGELLEAHARSHEGVCTRGEGDGVAVVFARASDAVACAIDLQRSFVSVSWPDELDLRVRMGLHSGEVSLHDRARERVTGRSAIDRCARIRDLGHGGHVLLSGTTAGLVADVLPEGAFLVFLGETELRGSPRPERVHQLKHADVPEDGPPVVLGANLPAATNRFVGRDGERAEVCRLLETARILTLTGTGGCGKTRLALEIARTEQRGRRTWWADLAPVRDASLVPDTVAGAIGLQVLGSAPTVGEIVRFLGHRPALLLLDNCEHLLAACAEFVTQIVRGCPDLTVLSTSREPLGIEGEVDVRVPSLAVADAVTLFLERAQEVRPDLELTEGTAAQVAEVCQRLDGIPLAIELAAARLRALSIDEVREGLEERFRLLTGGTRGSLPRQRTLEASVQWSYDLLSDDERLLFARLSVFSGSFDLPAVEDVCGDGRNDVLDTLSGLIDRSLVHVDSTLGATRYRLLETIRAYAGERLAEFDDPAAIRDRHLGHARRVAMDGGLGLLTDPETWYPVLLAESDNLLAAMEWAEATDHPVAVIDLVEPLFSFWTARNLTRELHRRLRAATLSPGLPAADRGRGLSVASLLAMLGGDFSTGHQFAAEAIEFARDRDDDPDRDLLVLATVLRAWTGFYSELGTNEQIAADLDEALASLDPTGRPDRVAWILVLAGDVQIAWRSIESGRATLERALQLSLDAALPVTAVAAHMYLTWTGLQGDFEEARAHAAEAAEQGGAVGIDTSVTFALSQLAVMEALFGREQQARRHATEARDAAARTGLPLYRLFAQHAQAVVESRVGDRELGLAIAEEALDVARRADVGIEVTFLLWIAGTAALEAGDPARARAHLDEACRRSQDPGSPIAAGWARVGLAHLALEEGDIAAAWELAHEALEITMGGGVVLAAIDALELIAAGASASSDARRAARLLGASQQLRSDLGVEPIRHLLDQRRRTDERARASLGPELAEELRREGAVMTWEEAVAYARRGRGQRGRPPSGWQSLTPAEVDVVRLVARGLRNADIAEELFVTVNTVKTHLAHVYAKLDCGSRAELAAAAARRDL